MSSDPKLCVVCSRVYGSSLTTCPVDGAALVSAPTGGSRLGQVVGNYRLLRVIGEGGVGTVYEAEHVRLGRKMAIKLLHSDVVTKEMVTRFFNEARAVNEIRHPNIIEVEDFVTTPDGEHYMLMELLIGEDLRTVISRDQKLAPGRVAEIGEQVASALAAVHRVGIVHRDLKPDNVFLFHKDGREVAKLLDFGIAKFTNDQQGVTRAGMTMGTPAYMAPEQIITGREKDVGTGSDIYALGMVLYEALTGAPAFQGTATAQILRAHCFEAVEPPSRRRGEPLPAVLEAAVMKCLEKDRDHRFATADELCAALRANLPVKLSGQVAIALPPSYDPIRTEPRRAVMMLPAFAMAVAALVLQLWPRSDDQANAAPAPAAVVKMPVQPQLDEPVAARPAAAVAATPVAAPVPASIPAPVPAATVTLTLASRPKGAELFLGEERRPLGRAPLITTVTMSSELVSLIARFPDGTEVAQAVVPDRALPELVFVQPAPVPVVATPTRRPPRPPRTTVPIKSTRPPTTSQDRDGTMDPFR